MGRECIIFSRSSGFYVFGIVAQLRADVVEEASRGCRAPLVAAGHGVIKLTEEIPWRQLELKFLRALGTGSPVRPHCLSRSGCAAC